MDFLSSVSCDSVGMLITWVDGGSFDNVKIKPDVIPTYDKLTALFRRLLFSGPKQAVEALRTYPNMPCASCSIPRLIRKVYSPLLVESGSNCHEMPSIYPRSVTNSCAPPRTGQSLFGHLLSRRKKLLKPEALEAPCFPSVSEKYIVM